MKRIGKYIKKKGIGLAFFQDVPIDDAIDDVLRKP